MNMALLQFRQALTWSAAVRPVRGAVASVSYSEGPVDWRMSLGIPVLTSQQGVT